MHCINALYYKKKLDYINGKYITIKTIINSQNVTASAIHRTSEM